MIDPVFSAILVGVADGRANALNALTVQCWLSGAIPAGDCGRYWARSWAWLKTSATFSGFSFD